MNNEPLEQRINKEWAKPNKYEYPEPIKYYFATAWNNGGYYRAKCPEKGCKYDGLLHPNGYWQHYTKAHRPDMNRQHAKRVINVIAEELL